ncbi:GspE/PulE family protein [Rhodanobacter aciditrophus]|uniref:GspE/PulE family protein n=1 Tax=Rhodanobacter aciditrophus TaxID=1623218 RepID=A0ABW4B0K7_9GAMM
MNLDALLADAIQRNASDIHLLLLSDQTTQMRYRIYGQLTKRESFSNGLTLINKIKINADLNVAESRRIQEGQFSFVLHGDTYFIRVSIVNSDLGEKVALRVLSPLKQLSLVKLGLSIAQNNALEHAISQKSGLILVCGATGSGKTTTLYSCLERIDDGSRTIYTIEDPIELPLPNIYQFEPNDSLEIDTLALLKSFMRQDPDVIMVGEIRDAKTADLAISAALTGHLVLATIHANSPLNVIHRCRHWNLDFFSLVSSLSLIIHQSMRYEEQGCKPKFSILRPKWGVNLPSTYQALIQETDLWQQVGSES